MKKLYVLICTLALLSVSAVNVMADGLHVIFNTDYEFISNSQLNAFNETLQDIEDDYDIGVYFVYDDMIEDSESALASYAEIFMTQHEDARDNVALVICESYYKLVFRGPAAEAIGSYYENEIWDTFYKKAGSGLDDGFASGIDAYYRYVVRLINEARGTQGAPEINGTPRVCDFADLLSDSEESKLTSTLQKLYDRYNMDVIAVTTDSTNGMLIDDYADDFYDYNGYAPDGVVLVVDMDTRQMYVSTKGKAIDYITDYGVDVILDDIIDDLSDGNYYRAFNRYASDVDSLLDSAINGEIVDNGSSHYVARFGGRNVAISAIAAAIASLFDALFLKGSMKTVKRQYFAGNYVADRSFRLTGSSDLLVDRRVSRSPRNTSNRSSSSGGFSGGGSSTHVSSSGSTHGGHGGHF